MKDIKIIVSTKWFPKVIKRALKDEFKNFVIDGVNNTIQFYDGINHYRENITSTVCSRNKIFRSKFNELQWYKVAKFIKKLPEQPIVIELNQIDEENISIVLCQFIQKF